MTTPPSIAPPPAVLCVCDVDNNGLWQLLARYDLQPHEVAAGTVIPGSYWGDSEAGLIGKRLYFRGDTPLQSVLHEAAHYVCMDATRRSALHTDAGGDFDEENAVCYLQIVLADALADFGRERMLADMDAWGYSFRLGSARAWFEQEADDARSWLQAHGVLDVHLPSWQLRQSSR
jgi:hypothetical protein